MFKKGILASALILTLASIFTRILGFVYRIYMSNTIGAEGMGLYQLIMPVYALAWSISCSGITTTVSKLVAQENAKKNYGNVQRILKQALTLSLGLSIATSLVLFVFAETFAISFFRDERTILSLKILAFSFPFMAAGSCIRGYFFGLQDSKVPAISQVFEQCVRMAVIFLLANRLMPLGLVYASATAIIGVLAGEVLSFLLVFYYYKRNKTSSHTQHPTLTPMQSFTMIVTMSLPLTAHRATGSLLLTFEDILIPQRLQMFGYSSTEAMTIFGQITGMAMPLIFFPSALLTSLSTSLVPVISEAVTVKNTKRITYTVEKAIAFTSFIGMGAAAVFVVFHRELGMAIYNQDIGLMLLILGFMCPLLYLQVTISGLLNGLSEQLFIFKNSLLSSLINLFFIYFFIPHYGILAFMAGWFVSLVITCTLSIIKIQKSIGIRFHTSKWLVLPLISATAAGMVTNLITHRFIFPYFTNLYALFVSCLFLGVFYVIASILTGSITIEDIKSLVNGLIPKSKRLNRDSYVD